MPNGICLKAYCVAKYPYHIVTLCFTSLSNCVIIVFLFFYNFTDFHKIFDVKLSTATYVIWFKIYYTYFFNLYHHIVLLHIIRKMNL
jgi:hypothetical protein